MSRAIYLLASLTIACDGTLPDLEPPERDAPHILHPEGPITADLWQPLRFDAFELVEGGRGTCCSATYRWTDGEAELGWGPSLITDELTLGEHEITLTITDPDGEAWTDSVAVTIAFLTPLGWDEGGEIHVFDGTDTTVLAKGSYPAFSPDGTELLYVEGDGNDQEIVRIGVDGTAPLVLTDDGRYDSKPTWSPDGTQFAWVHEDDDGDREIWVGDVDGTWVEPGTDMPLSADEPDWGTFGILFQEEGGPYEERELYRLPRPGAPPEQLTDDNADDNDPSWFHHGLGVLASRIEGDNQDIFHIDPVRGQRTQLTDDPADDDEASLSPDGTKILFESDRSGVNELYVMRLDGSQVTRVPLPSTSEGRFHAAWGYGSDAVVDDDPTTEPPGDLEAIADNYVVSESWPEDLWLTENDIGEDLVVTEVSQPAHGEVVLVDGVVTYLPDGTHLGPDTFTYVVTDGFGSQAKSDVYLEVVPSYSEGQGHYWDTPLLLVDGVYTHVFHDSHILPNTLVMRESVDGLLWGPRTSPVPASDDVQYAASLLTWTDTSSGETALGLTWLEQDASGTVFHRWFSRRIGADGAFSPPVQVSDHGPAGFVWGKIVPLGGDELLMVTNQSGPNDSSIRRNRSIDGGLSWTSEPTFGETGYYGTVTSVVADGDTVYVLTSADRYYKRNLELYISRDRGVTFGDAVDITGYTVDRDWLADFATLAVAPDGRLHVVWAQETPLDPTLRIFHTTSDDGGTTWASPFTQVSDDVPGAEDHWHQDLMPRLRFGGDGRVYVLWADGREDAVPEDPYDQNNDLYFSVSTDDGATWSPDVRINDAPEVYWQRSPSFLVEPGVGSDRILASWADNRHDPDPDDAQRYNKLLYTEMWAP